MRDTPNRLLDELSRAMTGAVGLAQGARKEADSFMRSQIERILRDADFVSRDEFEAMRQIALSAADQVEALEARLKALEDKLGKS